MRVQSKRSGKRVPILHHVFRSGLQSISAQSCARISASFLEHAFLLAHDKPLPAVFADNGKNCAVGLERGKSSAVTVLHPRDVHSDFTFALRTYHALRQRVARKEDVRRDLLRLEPHPAWSLNERPGAVERIVVPLPPEIKRLLFETV